jgi:hypothetical protein
MIDPSSAWLFGQAAKLVASIWTQTRENLAKEGADQLTGFVLKLAKKRPIGEGRSDAGAPAAMEAEIAAEGSAASQVVAADEAQAEELEDKFGVELSSALPRDRTGTDASLVRAYEAVLWRLAVLANWEQRAIAVGGALQGRDWMTVCAPQHPGAVVAPSAIWRAAPADNALRRRRNGGPFEFFVKPLAGNAVLADELAKVDMQLRQNDSKRFEPKRPARPTDVDAWHRVDGLHGPWVALRPDSETESAIADAAAPSFEGSKIGSRSFDTKPLTYGEYPDEWQALLGISQADGLTMLIEGIDKFAADSAAARTAVEDLFE